jgi:GNAT superfamily N-acetyltransferase
MKTAPMEFEPLLEEGIRRFIVESLDKHNMAITGLREFFPVNFVVREERGEIVAGVLGHLWGGWLQVNVLWVAEDARGRGYGTRLMESAESYARSKGAIGATLETHSFQARPFYERLGYEVFSTLEGYPFGHAKYYLRKALA